MGRDIWSERGMGRARARVCVVVGGRDRSTRRERGSDEEREERGREGGKEGEKNGSIKARLNWTVKLPIAPSAT